MRLRGRALNKINVRKASGPDRINGKLLKECKSSLFYIIHRMFEISFEFCTFPAIWKIGEIIPVAKKDLPKVDNDLRPVTLTSILSKCLERVGLWLLMPHVKDKLDPLQFAYVNGRSTDDAICNLMHLITKHLDEKPSNIVRATYIDYSSAFNTIQPHLLIQKLSIMNVPTYLRMWILDYMLDRPQFVRTKLEVSNCVSLNTGAPQGCVLSPVLFIIYTNDLSWNTKDVVIQKYADDTIILGLIKQSNDSKYKECVAFVDKWCQENFLNLNVTKTKEMVWDFRKHRSPFVPVTINNTSVEVVDSYKYLGLTIDNTLSFAPHIKTQVKKANKRVYCIRSMRSLRVNQEIITMFYNATIPSVLMYAACSFYGSITVQLRSELERPHRMCQRIVPSSTIVDNDQVYKNRMKSLSEKIMKDTTHPLCDEFQILPSGRRLRVPYTRTERYRKTFVPLSIKYMNGK